MSINQTLTRVLLLAAMFGVIQIALQVPLLPTPMAVHFDGAGNPNGWSKVSSFATVNVVLIALILLVFLILPSAMGKRPQLRWRLPNRNHWLAPERRAATVEYLQRHFLWYGIISLLLLMAVFQLVVDANVRKPPHLNSRQLIWLLLGYAAFVMLWFWSMWRRFSRPPPEKRDNPFA